VRKVYEQELETKETARQLLLNSRNLKADINNPNNPNYKGRPENKHIEQLLNLGKEVVTQKIEKPASVNFEKTLPNEISEKSIEETEEQYYDEYYQDNSYY
jgi:hypothetical protein